MRDFATSNTTSVGNEHKVLKQNGEQIVQLTDDAPTPVLEASNSVDKISDIAAVEDLDH